MLLRNLFEFIVVSPVVATSTVVSLSCVSILVVKVATNDSSGMESSISESSASVGSAAMQYIDNDVDEYINDAYQNSSEDDNAFVRSGAGRNNHKKSQSNIKQAYVNHNYYDAGSTSLEFEEPSNSSHYNDSAFSFYSGGSNSVNNSTITNTTSNASSDSSSADSDSVSTGNSPIADSIPDDPVLPESEYPVTLTREVQIDLDETQYISCRPVEANGPPCLCTFTLKDASGSASQVVNSCS